MTETENKENPVQPFENSSIEATTSATDTQDSVLLDVADMTGYDKSLKSARIWLYVIAGFQVLMGIYEAYTVQDQGTELMLIVFGIDAFIGLIFLACALWSYKKPYAAFVTGLVSYIVVIIGLSILDSSNLFKGILIKILVIIALVRAIKDARDIEDMKNSFNIPN